MGWGKPYRRMRAELWLTADRPPALTLVFTRSPEIEVFMVLLLSLIFFPLEPFEGRDDRICSGRAVDKAV